MEPFGTTRAGADVAAIPLRAGRLSARILTLGAILQDLRLDAQPLTLGSADLAAYDNGPLQHFGAVIGPVAGRLRDGQGGLAGRSLKLSTGPHPHALHCERHGLHRAIWSVADAGGAHVRLETAAAPGAGGLPGARRFAATYALSETALRLTLEAETDAATWINLTHHGYWRLGAAPGLDGHRLQIAAERHLPIDADTLPTGDIAPVAGTRFDFRDARVLAPTDRIDHCFCLSEAETAPRAVAAFTAPDGMALSVYSTSPGLQIFTGDGVSSGAYPGHDGQPYHSRPGLAIEPQGWPDAPNHPSFPSIEVGPGQAWRREIAWQIDPPQ